MANSNNTYGFAFRKNLAGGAHVIDRIRTISNVAISIGDPIVNTGGVGGVKLAGATSVALFGVSLETVTAVAATRKSVAFIPALPFYIFNAQHGGTLNLTAGYLGRRCGIQGATNGRISLNGAATTSICQIVGLKGGSIWGTYAELLFIINRSNYYGKVAV